jgi:hypothetical protein
MARAKKVESSAAIELELLLQLLDEGFERKAWHGPNLRGSLRGVEAEQAAWRIVPGRHNIWEITLHAAYWKYVVRRRLTGEKKGSFPLKGSNWFPRPDPRGQASWADDLALLDDVHRSLRQAVADMPPSDLHRMPAGSKLEHAVLIRGAAFHDVYHAGQIQALKRHYAAATGGNGKRR